MTTASANPLYIADSVPRFWDCSGPHWYAAYTLARHEKRVSQQMIERGLDCFLPLFASIHHWKDRNKRIELPLFPSYVFVHIALRDKLRVLQLPGVIQLVGKTNGIPTEIPDREINSIRVSVKENSCSEPYPYLAVGERVRIHSGPMAGCEGVLIRKQGGLMLVLSIHLLMRSVAVEISASDVDPIDWRLRRAPQQLSTCEAAAREKKSAA